QVLNAWAEAALDVVLQAGTQVISREINLAGRNQKAAMDQIDNAVSQIAGEIRPVIDAAVFAQPARDVNARVALSQGQLDIRIGLVIAQKDVEAGLFLLDKVIFKRQRLFIVIDN